MRMLSSGSFIVAVLTAAFVQAGSFNPRHVPADAKWILHVDFETIESADALRDLYEKRISKHRFVRSLKEGRWQLDIDLQTNVKGLTLYGKQFAHTAGTLIMYTDAFKGQATSELPDAPGHDTIPYRGHRLHTWSCCSKPTKEKAAEKNPTQDPLLAFAFPQNDVTVWAGDLNQLKAAVDAIDGRAEKLSEKKTLLSADSSQGTMFLVRAAGMQDTQLAESMPWLGQLKSFNYCEGIKDGRYFSRITAETGTPAVNRHVKNVVDGVVSAYWLMYGHQEPTSAQAEDTTEQASKMEMNVSVKEGQVEVRASGSVQQLGNEFSELWEWIHENPAKAK